MPRRPPKYRMLPAFAGVTVLQVTQSTERPPPGTIVECLRSSPDVGARLPLRLHLPPPLVGILLMHPLHLPRGIGMVLHHVPGHRSHHLVPARSSELTITGSAQLSARHRLHR